MRERLVAEIAELAPGLTQTVHWVYGDDPGQGLALAAELDQLAVTRDRPDLRSLADCVRLLSLPLPGAPAHDHDHRRVAKALAQAASQLPPTIDIELAAEVETISLGWAILPTSMDALTRLREDHAITAAYHAGRHVVQWRVALTEARLRKEFAEEKQAREKATAKAEDQTRPAAEPIDIPEDHVLVCQLSDADMKNGKMRELVTPLKAAINVPLPLAPVPPLHEVRNQLLFEFPYAADVIDFALADLVGRRTIRLRPLLLVGEPGGGKSRFVRRLAEILNLGCWRTTPAAATAPSSAAPINAGTPPLHEVRNQLLFEFPYAADVIDFALADLVGRRTIRLRPLLLVGEPGGGKSRFVRRLAEILHVECWRTDASRSDGATFGGTDKSWYSAEACHPFLAIARAKYANPIVLIDELEKAGTRSDYGRFWDCLLGFLEPETAARYPDPALQVTLDLSHVSYIATANSLDPLPAPLRDRFQDRQLPQARPRTS